MFAPDHQLSIRKVWCEAFIVALPAAFSERSWAPVHRGGFSPVRVSGLGGEEFKEQLFIDPIVLSQHRGIEEFGGHVHEDAEVAGGPFAQGGANLVGHQVGIAGLAQDMAQQILELGRRHGFHLQANADAGTQRHQFAGAEQFRETVVAAENDAQQGTGIEAIGAQEAQFADGNRRAILTPYRG